MAHDYSPDEDAISTIGEEAIIVQEALSMTAEKFSSLKVAERDAILFLMLRDLYATMAHLTSKVDEYETKAKELATPEGIQSLMDKFLSGGMGGGMGMLGGLLK